MVGSGIEKLPMQWYLSMQRCTESQNGCQQQHDCSTVGQLPQHRVLNPIMARVGVGRGSPPRLREGEWPERGGHGKLASICWSQECISPDGSREAGYQNRNLNFKMHPAEGSICGWC